MGLFPSGMGTLLSFWGRSPSLVLTTFRVRESYPFLSYPIPLGSTLTEKQAGSKAQLVLLLAAAAQEVKLPGSAHRPAS